MSLLLHKLYTIDSQTCTEDTCQAQVRWIPSWEIFGVHFAGHPIVPGACLVQLLRELLETGYGNPVTLTGIDNVKFLTPIDPRQTPCVVVRAQCSALAEGLLRVRAVVEHDSVIYAKMTLQVATE